MAELHDTLHNMYEKERIFLHLNEVSRDYVEIPWSYCLESLIYSTSEHGRSNGYSIIPTDSAG